MNVLKRAKIWAPVIGVVAAAVAFPASARADVAAPPAAQFSGIQEDHSGTPPIIIKDPIIVKDPKPKK